MPNDPSTRQVPAESGRLYLVDVLRGLASLTVVISHYYFFFVSEPGEIAHSFDNLPFFSSLSAFYVHGDRAVPLFFCISGFVFFHVYLAEIASRRVSFHEYAVFRFSRLYPLHFATLIIVAAAQLLSQRLDGRWIVVDTNDAWHFILNIFLVSSWRLEWHESFNAPAWSISIEILFYATFYVFARFAAGNRAVIAPGVAALVLGNAALLPVSARLGNLYLITSGMMFFYSGGIVYLLCQHVKARPERLIPMILAALATAIGSGLAFMWDLTSVIMFEMGVFPTTVLFLALVQMRWPLAARSCTLIGDLSYATYLIHFPIQLLIILAVRTWGIAVHFEDPAVLMAFVVTVCLAAIPVHFAFERPVQRYMRALMLAPRQVETAHTGPACANSAG